METMNIILYLILFPLIPALLLLLISNNTVRTIIVWVSSAVIIGLSVFLLIQNIDGTGKQIELHVPYLDQIMFGIECLIGRGRIDLSQAQPLAREVFGERLRLGMLQHPLHLRLQHFGPMQFAFFSKC